MDFTGLRFFRVGMELVLVGLLLATLASCTPWRTTYLEGGQNRLTTTDVTQRLGPPDATQPLDDGRAVWRYRYPSSYVMGNRFSISGGSTCTEYILTFDKNKILRQARHQSC